MLKMAELAELKQDGLYERHFFKILFKIQCCLKLLNIDVKFSIVFWSVINCLPVNHLWGIYASENSFFGIFITHSLTNSTWRINIFKLAIHLSQGLEEVFS